MISKPMDSKPRSATSREYVMEETRRETTERTRGSMGFINIKIDYLSKYYSGVLFNYIIYVRGICVYSSRFGYGAAKQSATSPSACNNFASNITDVLPKAFNLFARRLDVRRRRCSPMFTARYYCSNSI